MKPSSAIIALSLGALLSTQLFASDKPKDKTFKDNIIENANDWRCKRICRIMFKLFDISDEDCRGSCNRGNHGDVAEKAKKTLDNNQRPLTRMEKMLKFRVTNSIKWIEKSNSLEKDPYDDE